MTCATEECPNEAKKAGRCWRCVKYRKRNGSFPQGPPRTYDQWDTLMAAIRAWADADADAAFVRYARGEKSRIEARIARAAIRYAESIRKERLNVVVRVEARIEQ